MRNNYFPQGKIEDLFDGTFYLTKVDHLWKRYYSQKPYPTNNNTENKNNIKINDIYINRKRHRRLKNEIKRNFLCKYCNKTYGTEASLNQHLKIKHLIIIESKTK